MNKLGLYINNLMSTVKNTEEKPYLRELAIDELKKLNDNVSEFILGWINDIDTLPDFEKNTTDEAKEAYMNHWTCSICGKRTHEVEYDYLSGTDHLSCVLEEIKNQNNQIEMELNNE